MLPNRQHRPLSWCDTGAALISVSTVCSQQWANTQLSVMDGRPQLFHKLPLRSRFLYRYQLIPFDDRGTRVWTTCLSLLRSNVLAEVEPTTSQSPVRRCTCSATASPNWKLDKKWRCWHCERLEYSYHRSLHWRFLFFSRTSLQWITTKRFLSLGYFRFPYSV